MNKFTYSFLFVCCLANASHAGDLSFEDRKSVMDAQIELVNKQKALNDALRQLAGTSAIGLPLIISTGQVGNAKSARLLLPNGVISPFREGEMIRPGMVVTAIAPKQVMVTVVNNKKAVTVPLEFMGPPTDPSRAQNPSQNQATAVPSELLPPAPYVVPEPIVPVPSRPASVVEQSAASQPQGGSKK